MRLLLVEDHQRLADFVVQNLGLAGFVVDTCPDIDGAEEALKLVRYDAVILDRGLPDGDGLSLLRRMQAGGIRVPTLVLTARDGLDDRVNGLDAGADDYMVKPFATSELAARVRALLRRPPGQQSEILTFGVLTLDVEACEFRTPAGTTQLLRREGEMLAVLMRRAGRAVSKRVIEDLMDRSGETSANGVEATVSRLRKRLQAGGAGLVVHTVRGLGYMLAESRDHQAGVSK